MADTFQRRKNKFAQVSNLCAYDENLSLEAKGLMLIAMALPEDWKFNRTWLQKKAGVGRDKMQRVLKELEDNHYLVRITKQKSNGKMDGYLWFFDDEKITDAEREEIEEKCAKAMNDGGLTGYLKTRQPVNTAAEKPTPTNTYINKYTSESVNNAREVENFQSEPKPQNRSNSQQKTKAVNQKGVPFEDLVMTELLVATSGQLTKSKKHYAQLKIQEYQARFPNSESIADCWAYVVQAINHQYQLTGS